MLMARIYEGGEPIGPSPEQQERVYEAQKRLAEAARSLYLAHRELETVLRRHALSPAQVEQRIKEMLAHEL
jgi:hypothetical protein